MKLATAITFVLVSSLTLPALAQDAPPPPPPPVEPPSTPMTPPPPPMLVAPPPGREYGEPPPSSGLGLLIGGGILTGLGAINLAASIPICKSGLYNLTSSEQNSCAIASMALSGAVTAVGVTMLIVGASKRSSYNAWRAEHPVAAGFGYQAVRGGGGFGFSSTF